MSPQLEAAKLRAVADLLSATAEDWHDINFHGRASDLEEIADQLRVLARKVMEDANERA